MAKRKSITKKSVQEKTTIIKIAGKMGELAGRIVNQSDHLIEMAGSAIESVKTAVNNIIAKETLQEKKPGKGLSKAVKKSVQSPAKKISKTAIIKKAPATTKPVKKTGHTLAKKSPKKKGIKITE